jgi:hypothetical protein
MLNGPEGCSRCSIRPDLNGGEGARCEPRSGHELAACAGTAERHRRSPLSVGGETRPCLCSELERRLRPYRRSRSGPRAVESPQSSPRSTTRILARAAPGQDQGAARRYSRSWRPVTSRCSAVRLAGRRSAHRPRMSDRPVARQLPTCASTSRRRYLSASERPEVLHLQVNTNCRLGITKMLSL